MTRPYPYPPAESYRLIRDGEEIMRGTEQECWKYLHDNHSYSVFHALNYEGYAMEPAS